MILYIEFFNNQNPREIERILRGLSKRKKFPKFARLTVMIDHKNLRRIDIEDKYPMTITGGDLKKVV